MLRKLAIFNGDMPVPFQQLEHEKWCLFPELQNTQFSYLDVDIETTPEAFVALLPHHAPKLRVCNLLDAGDMKRSAEWCGQANFPACYLHSSLKMEIVWNVIPCLLL